MAHTHTHTPQAAKGPSSWRVRVVNRQVDGSKYTGQFWCDKHHGDGVEAGRPVHERNRTLPSVCPKQVAYVGKPLKQDDQDEIRTVTK